MKKRKMTMNLLYIPALILLLLFVIYPLGNAFYISLTKWNGYSQAKSFVGLSNYVALFQDKNFFTALRNTIIYGFGSTLLQNILGLLLALYLNMKFKGRGALRTIVYLPVMISGLVMGYIMYFFFQYNHGVVNEVLALFGGASVDWLANGFHAVIIMTCINAWQFVGLSMVMYLAGLQNIPAMYYEASQIDGAGTFARFRYITLPLLTPAIASAVMINLIGGLKLFDIIRAMTSGGPGFASHSLSTYLANQYFDAEKAGYAGAVGVFIFAFIMIVANLLNAWFRRRENEL